MKLQKTTWILVIIAALLGGLVYFYEVINKPQREEIQARQKQIFDFERQDIQKLTIETKGKTLEFERTKYETNPWRMKQPENTLANDAAVSYLLDLLVEGESDRTFKISPEQRKDYGLNPPLATIKIQLQNQENHQLILGKPNFEDKFIYAQVDSSKQTTNELNIFLVSKDFQYAVERKFEEWKQASNQLAQQLSIE